LSKRLIQLASIFAVAVAALYFLVLPSQRRLTLVATDDVSFYDGENRAGAIFRLQKGSSVTINGCRDTKSEIEPFIMLSNGQKAYPLTGHFEILTKPTGTFSWPQYLGCGDF
jgi:hypothetical protein